MPRHDAAIVKRMREGDTRIPPQELRELVRRRHGDARVSAIIRTALMAGERPQRRNAVAAVVALIQGLARDVESPEARAHRLQYGLQIPTERRMAEWAQALKDERDDTP